MHEPWINAYEMSRNVFETTIKNEPGESPLFWTDLQLRLSRWSNYEYGYQSSERMVLGLMEEYEEFIEATDPPLQADALADMSIFLIQYVNGHRLDAGVLIGHVDQPPALVAPRWIGRLAHVELKYLHGIRGMRDTLGLEHRDNVRGNVAINAMGLFAWLKEATERLAVAFPRQFVGPIETVYQDLVYSVANEVMARKKRLLPQVLGVTQTQVG